MHVAVRRISDIPATLSQLKTRILSENSPGPATSVELLVAEVGAVVETSRILNRVRDGSRRPPLATLTTRWPEQLDVAVARSIDELPDAGAPDEKQDDDENHRVDSAFEELIRIRRTRAGVQSSRSTIMAIP